MSDITVYKPRHPLAFHRKASGMTNIYVFLSLTLMLMSLIPTSVSAAPITDVKQLLEQEIIAQGLGNNIKIESARFVINSNLYSLKNIALSGLEGDYIIDGITVDSNQRFNAILSADEQKIKVHGRFSEYLEIPVFSHIINRGDVIEESDIRWIEISTHRLRQHYFTDAQEMIGKAAVRRLTMGRPILVRDVTTPTIVAKGGVIRVIYRNKYMNLKTIGKAMQKASVGDIISIKNIKSGAIIQAMITEHGEAIVNYGDLI